MLGQATAFGNPLLAFAQKGLGFVSQRLYRTMPFKLVCVLSFYISSNFLLAADPAFDAIEPEFHAKVRPFLIRYCDSCHSGDSPEAKLDTTILRDTNAVAGTWDSWQAIVSRVHECEMPPADSAPQPSAIEREQFEAWTKQFRRAQALEHQGDPGPVGTRRLSNAEWNYTIRDLTGIDIQPAKNFPVDPANVVGFDNSAESLTISPSLVVKYLDAARVVADHLILTPDGIRFAPHTVVTDTDRDKYCVHRIVDFYHRQPTQYEDYLFACWKMHVGSFASSSVDKSTIDMSTIDNMARELQISPKYLKTVWETLNHPGETFGPMSGLRTRWRLLCAKSVDAVARAHCAVITDWIHDTRDRLKPKIANLRGAGVSDGSQSLVLWKNRQMANSRRSFRGATLAENAVTLTEKEIALLEPKDAELYGSGNDTIRQMIIQAYDEFCSIFPDAFYISERGRSHIDDKDADKEGKGRLLSAGFHSMMGYFRDDQPLVDLVLSQEQQTEIDRLWLELDFITLAPIRQYSGFMWYERAESSFINEEAFNFVRAEDRSATTSEMIQRFANVYLEKVRRKQGSQTVVEAVTFYFDDMDRQIRQLESQLEKSQAVQLDALLRFAEQAFRRPMSNQERESIRGFYQRARSQPNSDHRSAMEDTLISILVSPSHLYRWDLQIRSIQTEPLTDYELASRLSYFLWSSKPDDRLLSRAANHELSKSEVLRNEMTRMLADQRARGMVREFMGNWLDFRRFDSHNGVDRGEFPMFDDGLRASMAEEPIEYFLDLVRNDGSVAELLNSDHIVVNRSLALHYGIGDLFGADENTWQRLDGVQEMHRGGLIPMGVFLTQNSPGLRTSPVKRGYWVVRKLLGEKIPPPPPNVPELPASEHQLGDMTLRELLAKHREHPSCASCHNRFDAYGLLLEGFDPVGRPRTVDLGGRIVPTDATLPSGQSAEGLQGLRAYLSNQRLDDFRRHFCQSLLWYALGRSPIIPDDLVVEQMLDALKQNNDRIRVAFDVIIQSPQFRNKRGAVGTPSATSHEPAP